MSKISKNCTVVIMLLISLILVMPAKAKKYGVFMKTFAKYYCVAMTDGV